jgi:hypothetical protein
MIAGPHPLISARTNCPYEIGVPNRATREAYGSRNGGIADHLTTPDALEQLPPQNDAVAILYKKSNKVEYSRLDRNDPFPTGERECR